MTEEEKEGRRESAMSPHPWIVRFVVTVHGSTKNKPLMNANERKYSEKSEKNEGWIVFMAHSLPEQPVHLKWVLHLLPISVHQRSLAVSLLLFRRLQPCAVNGYVSSFRLSSVVLSFFFRHPCDPWSLLPSSVVLLPSYR
jgi:hypothetical protein